MPVNPEDRPISALREEVIDQLISNYGHGKLALEAFERRLESALDAKDHQTLIALTADLDLAPDRAELEMRKDEIYLGEVAEPVKEVEHMINVFGGSNRRGCWAVPEEIRMVNVFGGSQLDFESAQFFDSVVYIKILCLFGGATLFVPDNFNVTSNAVCIFGGVEDKGTGEYDPDAPTIVIQGLCLFGGLTIKTRRSLKQRLIDFADGFRNFIAPAGDGRA